ncbi:biotin--[acetyl-CoA-carboxylase] ligase [Halocynthiibacter namhaensis]|uniref:biotin--[acetyl-CoA-carboxylase] ligase n=1 Tax=Halocynthiibacter namhaensis TaxID=1290553 RepID=UPI0005793196|nr:biotin--[acetyl-CoA-carboxylase] ligase [Halocynthiibacter namhaensis]
MSTKWPEGVGRIVLPSVDSTNAEAIRQAPTLSGPTWILGLEQTKGRARRGRGWVDPKGNFSATLALRPDGKPGDVALYSFVAALALYDACVAATGRADAFALKWPNDVLLNGGKLAGILLESAGIAGQSGLMHLAVGIGVNLADVPLVDGLEKRAVRPVSLQEAGAHMAPETFLDLLAPAFAQWEHRLKTYGFGPLREGFLARAARLGDVITARTGTAEITGTFETIDEAGSLVLKTTAGRQVIAAADIFF